MADGLLSGLTNWIDQRKQAAKSSIGLLADNPQEWLAQTTARYLPTKEEQQQYRAVKQAGGDITQTPYYQKIFDLAQFQSSLKPLSKTQFQVANEVAQKNATEMLGLPPDNTAMDRAKALGFDMQEFHGTSYGDFAAFDPSKMKDNVQYGGSIYTTKDPQFASRVAESKWSGDSPTVMPVMIRSGKKFDMAEPISAEDAAKVLNVIGQSERAGKIAASGKPYRSGSEFFYWGIGQDLPNSARGAAINRGGFDVITGDPSLEISGKAGKPQTAIFDPSRIRSRFAAFDPARVNETDLLAAGIPIGLLGSTQVELPKKQEKKPKK
jgi:hypothetical protein